jgi:hypothetical protein
MGHFDLVTCERQESKDGFILVDTVQNTPTLPAQFYCIGLFKARQNS